MCLSYDVCAERSEGMGPAHVQMGRVEALQEANVIKTLRLQNIWIRCVSVQKQGHLIERQMQKQQKENTAEETQTTCLPYYLFP